MHLIYERLLYCSRIRNGKIKDIALDGFVHFDYKLERPKNVKNDVMGEAILYTKPNS